MEKLKHKGSVWIRILKRSLKTLVILVSVFVFGLASICGLLYYFQDQIKALVVSELNKNLNAEVRIAPQNINLTLLRTFPDCSIEFQEVLMYEALARRNRDTLVYAGLIRLHFNVLDVYHGKYNIKKISLQEAKIKACVLKDGSNNFTFYKKAKSSDNKSVSFKIEDMLFKNVSLFYDDQKNKFYSSLQINKLSLQGEFNDVNYQLKANGDCQIRRLQNNKQNYLANTSLGFSLALKVNKSNYKVKTAHLNLNKLSLDLNGGFTFKDSLSDLAVRFNAPQLDVRSVLSFLPGQYQEKINDYESEGLFYTNGELVYQAKSSYSFSCDFGIKNGKVSYKPNNAIAENVNVAGGFKITPKNSTFRIQRLNLRFGKDSIDANFNLTDFNDPFLELQASAKIDLNKIHQFWPIDTLQELEGRLKLFANIKGKLSDLRARSLSNAVSIEMDAETHDLKARFKGDSKLYSVEHCKLLAKDREIIVDDLRLKRGGSDLVLNGRMPGLFNYLANNDAGLKIEGTLQSQNIVLEDFIGDRQAGTNNAQEPLIRNNVAFKLDAQIKKFSLGKFVATEISGDLEIRNQKAIVNEMKFTTMQGEAVVNVFADNSKGKLDLVIQSKLKQINVPELFSQMNNFGQQTLMHQNVKGFASAEIDFAGSWSNGLESDPASIMASCDLRIDRGELINFKPLNSLAKFVDVKELQHVVFSELKSKIEIRDQAIIFPKTSIKNSALNIDFWGTHYFSSKIDYHIQLLMSELLAKKWKNRDEEFAPVAADPENRRSAFILMTGTVDDPHLKYDKRGLKEKIREDIIHEKQNLKRVFKEEVMTFKRTDEEKDAETSNLSLSTEPTSAPKAAPKTLQLKKKQEEEDF